MEDFFTLIWLCTCVGSFKLTILNNNFWSVWRRMKADKVVLFLSLWMNPQVCPFKWKLLNSTFLWYYLLCSSANKVVVTFESLPGWNPYGVSIQMKASEQYFSVVLFIMQYIKMVVNFESVDEILWCEHSDESFWAVLFCLQRQQHFIWYHVLLFRVMLNYFIILRCCSSNWLILY